MKITKEEVEKKSQEKLKAIQTLCNQLQMVATAEVMLTPQGFIKQIVYYNDTEKYDIIEEQPNKKTYDNKSTTLSDKDGKAIDTEIKTEA